MKRLVKKLARYIPRNDMGEVKIKLEQIRLSLENETRKSKDLPILANFSELMKLPPKQQYWEEIPDIFKTSVAAVKENKVYDGEGSIVLKFFANKETMEIRQFAAKFTDEKKTRDLNG